MRNGIRIGAAAVAALALLSCGGGKTAVVGIGNSGNRIGGELAMADELAELFVETGAAPEVDDAALREIFASFEQRARIGDIGAALVVLAVAAEQREAGEAE